VPAKRVRIAAAVGLAFALLVAGCGGDDSSNSTSATTDEPAGPPVSLQGTVNDHGSKDLGSETVVEMELDDSYFSPTFVTAAPGSTVTVKLENEGAMPHTLTIDGTSVNTEVQPGASATVTVTLPTSGSMPFYCRFHRGSGMQGAFVVSGTASGASAPATGAPSGGY